jgi:hypothetical protein
MEQQIVPPVSDGTSLRALVAGILLAVEDAKRLGDMETGRLLELYSKEPLLASATVPAFAIADLQVELRFIIVGVSEGNGGAVADVRINATAAGLKDANPSQVQVMQLKLSPTLVRATSPQNQ